ncbi:MAG: beta-propeller domain-containing protein [Ruminococcus sp.]|nr:beta-propeller domain-containing protein [Ruminococcus sp.]
MSKNNYDEIKNMMNEPEIPKELEPEQIKNVLDSRKEKSKNIKYKNHIKVIAGIAACGVIVSTGAFAANKYIESNKLLSDEPITSINKNSPDKKEKKRKSDSSINVSQGYTASAKDYQQVYDFMKNSEKKSMALYKDRGTDGAVMLEDGVDSIAESAVEDAMPSSEISSSEVNNAVAKESENTEFSETYNQEKGVLESDIVKTDGKYIYFTESYSYDLEIQVTEVDKGHFVESYTLDLEDDLPENVDGYINSMYLKDEHLIVIVDGYEFIDDDSPMSSRTYVLTYQTGKDIELLGLYAQDGIVSDVRLMEDGTLYLVTAYSWMTLFRDDNYNDCIPAYYSCGNDRNIAKPDEILIPETPEDDDSEYENYYGDSFTNIGSINIMSDKPENPIDFKCLAGFNGNMYCSLDNIYLASQSCAVNNVTTDFTRLSIDNGIITPNGVATVDGYIKDQFSMSEYNGYFRVAVTQNHTEETKDEMATSKVASMSITTDNALYVFDNNMQQVGKLEHLAETETIQSVNFQGDKAYIVTFRQTDPLFAIDLSDPTNPVVLDEYKITGYSSYMQKWDNTHLLGFGIDADDDGIELGLKLVMFDNSDPNNLKALSVAPLHFNDLAKTFGDRIDSSYVYSMAEYDRKALLIDPDKNIIAVPFECYQYNSNYSESTFDMGYALYSYNSDNNTFEKMGVFYGTTDSSFERSVYIDNVIYLISEDEIISVDLNTMTEIDRS